MFQIHRRKKISHITYEQARTSSTKQQEETDANHLQQTTKPKFSTLEDLPPLDDRPSRPLTMWPILFHGVLGSEGYVEVPLCLSQPQFLDLPQAESVKEEHEKPRLRQRAHAKCGHLRIDVEAAQRYSLELQVPEPQCMQSGGALVTVMENSEKNEPPNLSKIKKMRDRIAEGRMEKVIPPIYVLDPNRVGAKQRPSAPPSYQPLLPSQSTNMEDETQKVKSASSSTVQPQYQAAIKVIQTKRREIVEKFRPSFEFYLNQAFRLPSQLVRPPNNVFRPPLSAGSATSFYCFDAKQVENQRDIEMAGAADEEPEQPTPTRKHNGVLSISSESRATRASCDVSISGEVNSLFGECEYLYQGPHRMRSLSGEISPKSMSEHPENDMKPTPPLKIKKVKVPEQSNPASPPPGKLVDALRNGKAGKSTVEDEEIYSIKEQKLVLAPKGLKKNSTSTLTRNGLAKDYGKYTFTDDRNETEPQAKSSHPSYGAE